MKEKIQTFLIVTAFLAMLVFPLVMMFLYPEAYVLPVYNLL